MNKVWINVFIAAIFEVCWVVGLKHAYDFWTWGGTVVAIIISFSVMIHASGRLPVGTVYAVFVGLGTVGTVMVDMLLFGEPFQLIKIMLIIVLLIGVLGLKLLSQENGGKR